MDSYRPVSTLSFISKLIERVVFSRLSDYLVSNKLLDPFQSAYRRFHSCETALLKIMNDAFLAVDNKKVSILTLLDLSAAFDTVDYNILKKILISLHITGQVQTWIMDYLSNRKQSVMIGNAVSPPVTIQRGVPQGSVLGPLLFSIYLFDIGSVFRTSPLAYMVYADDIQMQTSIKPADVPSAIDDVQSGAEQVCKYLTARKLKLNSSKTEIILIGSRKTLQTTSLPTDVTICNSVIQVSRVVRNLGFFIDSQLNFTDHVSRITSSAFHYLKIIGRLRNSLDEKTAMTLVHSLVMSRVNFCAPLLYGIHKKLINRLQRIQNAAFRMILKKKRSDSVSDDFKRLGCLTVEKLLQFRCLCLAHRIIHTQAPEYLAGLLKEYAPSRTLRSSSLKLLEVPRTNAAIGERAFSVSTPSLWNSLPGNIREIRRYDNFRASVAKYLLECP
jgi:hypothetical protein